MRKHIISGILVITAAVVFTACERRDAPPAEPREEVAEINTRAIEEKFENAAPEVRDEFNRAVAAVKRGDYRDALDDLQRLASNAKLTPEQQEAARDLLKKVQDAVTRGATKAVEGAGDAIQDVKRSLPNNN